jgi:hypothetical protein
LLLRGPKSCPPQNRAASTKPPPTGVDGFVEAIRFMVSVYGEPSRAFRDGMDMFEAKLSYYQG